MGAYLGQEIGKRGFGMMRLPRKLARIDVGQTAQMVDEFLAAGFSYFDTAWIYPGSEDAVRKALIERHPRESFQLATKLNAMVAPTAGIAKKQFETSLKRTKAGYFDYYLLHTLMDSNIGHYERLGIWEFALEQKAAGLVHHVGFSFHSGPETLDKLLTEHPETEFVQLQLNYADWENPSVASRANYEVARSHNVPIVVMEPVKGGKLANPPAAVRALLDEAAPNASYASWAIRFAASLEGIITVLSGMSNLDQMRDNLSYMCDFQPLTESERAVLREAQRLMGCSNLIGCTACRYCVDGCPQGIAIPEIFEAMNQRLEGRRDEAQRAYAAATAGANGADACIGCGACEAVCTQNLRIIDHLNDCAKAFAH